MNKQVWKCCLSNCPIQVWLVWPQALDQLYLRKKKQNFVPEVLFISTSLLCFSCHFST